MTLPGNLVLFIVRHHAMKDWATWRVRKVLNPRKRRDAAPTAQGTADAIHAATYMSEAIRDTTNPAVYFLSSSLLRAQRTSPEIYRYLMEEKIHSLDALRDG